MIVVYRSMCITGVSVEVITVVKGLQMVYLVFKLDYDTFFFFFFSWRKGTKHILNVNFFLFLLLQGTTHVTICQEPKIALGISTAYTIYFI